MWSRWRPFGDMAAATSIVIGPRSFRGWLKSETVERVRDNLLNLADQYDGLAAPVAAGDHAWPQHFPNPIAVPAASPRSRR
jgi:hypothetical protein